MLHYSDQQFQFILTLVDGKVLLLRFSRLVKSMLPLFFLRWLIFTTSKKNVSLKLVTVTISGHFW